MVAPGAKKPSSSRLDAALRVRHEALALVQEQFRDFDVVWAKVHGFPWWPGVLFHSWDVVRRAGIRTDPAIEATLVVPPPEKVEISGQETIAVRVRRHCLVMFLDKFNFSVVEVEPGSVASFTAHYQLYERAVMGSKSSKNRNKTEFRRALVKADQLLHMGKEFVEDDLVMLEEPSPAEKKQRMEEVMGVAAVEEDGDGDAAASLNDAWDDPEDAAFSVEEVDGDMAADEKKPPKKPQKKASKKPSTNRKRKAVEVKDADEQDEDDVVILTPAKPRLKAPAKDSKQRARKPSRKEGHGAAHAAVVSPSPSPIDLTGTPESAKKMSHGSHKEKAGGKASGKPPKPRKKKVEGDATGKQSKSKQNGHAKILVLDEDDDAPQTSTEQDGSSAQVSDEVTDITEEEPSNLVLTPLSSIWTTSASDDQTAGSGAHVQLAYKQAFVWDDTVFSDDLSIAEIEQKQAEDAAAHAGPGRDRSLGKRQSRSVQQSHIRQNLMTGNLDPHTMVQCAAYRPKDFVEDPNSRSRGGPTLDPPFQVVVHPDAVFVADLHAHLATCEIIGFLGGKWDEASKTLYIQAAFPCRSLVIDGDDGSTDVEMDPGSEIELRGIIENAQLEVVGWYHSHPAFAPDPSVRDIENQTSYQQLFQRPSTGKDAGEERKPSEPFVGLIVGTYDTRRSTPVSLFRYFHTRGEKVSGGACREIYMPYEFIPGRRHFRSVLQYEERERTRLFPMYHSVLHHFKLELSSVKQQLPTDIKSVPTRRSTSRSSPTRVRAHVPIRKRKQSSENAGDKSTKKARAKSRRSTLSSTATASSHIDLTGDGDNDGDDDNQKWNPSENGTISDEERESMKKRDLPTDVETTTSDGVTVHDVKTVSSSNGVSTKTSSSDTAKKPSLEVHSVEQEVAEVVADVVVSAEIAINNDGGKRKRSRKGHHPTQINENSSGSGGDESKHLPIDNAGALQAGASTDKKISRKMAQPGLAIKIDVDATGAPTAASVLQSSSTSASPAVKPGMSPVINSGSSGRKRNRKPKKTTKNSNRSTSPVSDGPSPGMSPNPANAPAQTFYDAFQASGPRISNGSAQEEVPQQLTRDDGPKPDNLMVEDMEYIFVDENMVATNCIDDHRAGDKVDKATAGGKTKTNGDVNNQEVRSCVNSLMDQVVKSLALTVANDGKLSARDSKEVAFLTHAMDAPTFIADSTEKTLVNGVVKAEVEDKALKGKPIGEASQTENAGHSSSSHTGTKHDFHIRAGPQLFGSNGECEDIQTSLQKMGKYLDKLKSTQTAKSGETMQTEAIPQAESKLDVVQPEPKQDTPKGEQDYLTALRTKYGAGVSGCAEQVITLVDYYRDFERRTDLSEVWKSRITKLEKIEGSLSEYVQFLNLPAALRHDFIKDLISYLRETWAIDRRR